MNKDKFDEHFDDNFVCAIMVSLALATAIVITLIYLAIKNFG